MATMKNFDGSGDYVEKTSVVGVDPGGSWFWGMWVKYNFKAVDGNCILRVGDGDGSSEPTRGFVLFINAFNRFRFVPAGGSGQNMDPSTRSAGVWYRIGGWWSGAGISHWVVDGVLTEPGSFITPPSSLQASDAWVVGEQTVTESTNRLDFDGVIGFNFWVNTGSGNLPDETELDDYLKDPQTVLDNFGPSGSVDADACKMLWGFCSDGDATDESGTGNTGTTFGTDGTVDESPTDYPTWDPCAAGGEPPWVARRGLRRNRHLHR